MCSDVRMHVYIYIPCVVMLGCMCIYIPCVVMLGCMCIYIPCVVMLGCMCIYIPCVVMLGSGISIDILCSSLSFQLPLNIPEKYPDYEQRKGQGGEVADIHTLLTKVYITYIT